MPGTPGDRPSTAPAPRVVTFGEVMARLMPPGHLRVVQATSFDVTFGGAEVNVAVDLVQLGADAAFVTKLPADNDLARSCVNQLRGLGVDTRHVLRGGGRMGLYFVERGAGQRSGTVLYDRAGSALANAGPEDFDWPTILTGASWFHCTGITPALGDGCAAATVAACRAARAGGLTVSCDVNYRRKLWPPDRAAAVLSELLPLADVCMIDEGTAGELFGVRPVGNGEGPPEAGRSADVARQLAERFGLRAVAMSLRAGESASRNGWAGLLYADGRAYVSRRYELDIVDRLGGGDAFAAGLIYSLATSREPQAAVEFAAAAGCLKHSVFGDFNLVTRAEVEALVAGEGTGRVRR